jgi:hypothetical protein
LEYEQQGGGAAAEAEHGRGPCDERGTIRTMIGQNQTSDGRSACQTPPVIAAGCPTIWIGMLQLPM